MQGKAKTLFNRKSFSNWVLNYALYVVLCAMILYVVIKNPNFLFQSSFPYINFTNILNILTQASTRGIMALRVAGLIVLQGTDLSAGRIVGICGIVSASLLQAVDFGARMYEKLPWDNSNTFVILAIPLLISVAIGLIFGIINGFGVAVLKLHAFIITLGTQLIAYGIACIYIESSRWGAQPLGGLNDAYTGLVRNGFQIGNVRIPYLIFYAAFFAIVIWFIWNKTKLGKNMFAIGGNPEAAAVSGVNIVKNIMYIYMISGALYGFAGYLEAARVGSGTTNLGLNYELDAIAACVVGGVSFSGGVGTIPGVLIGVIILQFINYGLIFINVNPYLQYVIKGLIIIFAVSLDVRKYLTKK